MPVQRVVLIYMAEATKAIIHNVTRPLLLQVLHHAAFPAFP